MYSSHKLAHYNQSGAFYRLTEVKDIKGNSRYLASVVVRGYYMTLNLENIEVEKLAEKPATLPQAFITAAEKMTVEERIKRTRRYRPQR